METDVIVAFGHRTNHAWRNPCYPLALKLDTAVERKAFLVESVERDAKAPESPAIR